MNPPAVSARTDFSPLGELWNPGLIATLAHFADRFMRFMRGGAAAEPVAQHEASTLAAMADTPNASAADSPQPLIAAPIAFQSGGWAVGNIVGLNCGTEIRVGPGLAIHTIVPEDNWSVMIMEEPRFVGGETWWNTSRAAAGDPSGGTGWVSQQQSEGATCEGGGGGGEPAIIWAMGEIIGLCIGTEIRHGPALVVHTVVPEADWQVKILSGPQSYNGQTWWDTSRRDAGDPSGGTGWVSQEQTELACSGGGNPDLFLGPEPLAAALRALFRTYGSDAWRLLSLAGDPANVTTGGLTYSTTDFDIPGVAGFDLNGERLYHSNDTRDSVFGIGWSSLLDTSLRIANDGSVDVRYPDGHGSYFVLGGGQYVPGQEGVFDTLTYDDGAKTFTLTTAKQVTFQFTDKGLLTETRDRHGNAIRIDHDGDRVTRIVDSGGRVFTLAYDGDHVSAVTDPINRTIRYGYANGDLTAVTDSNGGVDRFDYTDHRITRMVDPENIAFLQNIYDGAGRIVEQIDAVGSHSYFSYDDGNRRTTYTDNLGNKTVYTYDDLKRIINITDALNQTEGWAYDADYNVTSYTNKRGLTYTYTYDDRGNQLTATDPLGGIKRFTYNGANDVTSYTDELNRTTVYEYDGSGNLVRTVRPDGSSVRATYDGRGQLVTETDPNGNTTAYTYDGAGNLVQVTNALQQAATSTYDGVGRRVAAADANGHRAQFVYDNNNNLVRVIDPKGQATTYRYDGNDSLVEVVDRRGRVTRFAYDVNLKLVREEDAEGHVTQHAYDAMYNRTSSIDPRVTRRPTAMMRSPS